MRPELPKDTRLVVDAIARELAGSDSPDRLREVCRARFGAGVTLAGTTAGTVGAVCGTEWLLDGAPAGPGWRPVTSWTDLARIAPEAGEHGLALVCLRPPDCGETVVVHIGQDRVVRAILIGPDPAAPRVVPLDQLDSAAVPEPAAVAVIDRCGEVHPARSQETR
jgi:hypothetical protein